MQLESLWPPHKLTEGEKVRVIDAVTSIVDHFRAPSSQRWELSTTEVTVEPGKVRSGDTSQASPVMVAVSNFRTLGLLSYSAAHAVVGLGLISNPVGWTIAMGAGAAALSASIWSAVKGYQGVREKHLVAALANLERAMQQVVYRAYGATHRSFQEATAEFDARARDGFDEVLDSAKAAVAKRVNDVAEAQTRSAKDSQETVDNLSSRLTKLSELAKEIKSISNDLRPEAA